LSAPPPDGNLTGANVERLIIDVRSRKEKLLSGGIYQFFIRQMHIACGHTATCLVDVEERREGGSVFVFCNGHLRLRRTGCTQCCRYCQAAHRDSNKRKCFFNIASIRVFVKKIDTPAASINHIQADSGASQEQQW
jgi:hypothetical protein